MARMLSRATIAAVFAVSFVGTGAAALPVTAGGRDGVRYTPWAVPAAGVTVCGSGHEPPSSSGPGYRPFKAAARVRIPLGARPIDALTRGIARLKIG